MDFIKFIRKYEITHARNKLNLFAFDTRANTSLHTYSDL